MTMHRWRIARRGRAVALLSGVVLAPCCEGEEEPVVEPPHLTIAAIDYGCVGPVDDGDPSVGEVRVWVDANVDHQVWVVVSGTYLGNSLSTRGECIGGAKDENDLSDWGGGFHAYGPNSPNPATDEQLSCQPDEGGYRDWPIWFEAESDDGTLFDCAIAEFAVDLVDGLPEDCRVVEHRGNYEETWPEDGDWR